MCREIHTNIVRDAHGYTRSDTPWRIAELRAPRGMRDFGADVREEEHDRRQNRFLVGLAIGFVVWLTLLVV